MIQKTFILQVNTSKPDEMINITSEISDFIKKSGVKTGYVILFVPHTTAAITINENADPDVKTDMIYGLSKVFIKDRNYTHYEGNSHAHIKSTLVGVDQTVIIDEYKMVLGTWQGLYFMEFDGPRSRRLMVRVCGE